MKAIIALSLLITCFNSIASNTDGGYTAGTTCDEVWAISPQANSKSFIEISKTNPDITDLVKSTSISVCEGAKRVGSLGGTLEQVITIVNAKTRGLPEDKATSIAFMAVSGWKIGEMGR